MHVTWFLLYLASGTVVGFLAGLLGIGGGMTLVPILSAIFTAQALAPEHAVHLGLGTAMASVTFTSASSVRAHHRFGAVDWSIVRAISPGTVVGSLAATGASGWMPQRVLAIAFAIIVFAGATQMILGRKPEGSRGLPGTGAMFAIGAAIGTICGLVSAGGAFLTVPFMLWCGVSMRVAIGTAAAIGVPVAVVGTVGYVVSGWAVTGLPAHTLGFVDLPALAAIVACSVLTAPLGARLTHRLPVAGLKRVFALLLYALAARMIVAYW